MNNIHCHFNYRKIFNKNQLFPPNFIKPLKLINCISKNVQLLTLFQIFNNKTINNNINNQKRVKSYE